MKLRDITIDKRLYLTCIYLKCSITAGASETVAHFVEYVSVVGGKAKTLVKALTKLVKS